MQDPRRVFPVLGMAVLMAACAREPTVILPTGVAHTTRPPTGTAPLALTATYNPHCPDNLPWDPLWVCRGVPNPTLAPRPTILPSPTPTPTPTPTYSFFGMFPDPKEWFAYVLSGATPVLYHPADYGVIVHRQLASCSLVITCEEPINLTGTAQAVSGRAVDFHRYDTRDPITLLPAVAYDIWIAHEFHRLGYFLVTVPADPLACTVAVENLLSTLNPVLFPELHCFQG